MTTSETWRYSWDEFVNFLETEHRNGKSFGELSNAVAGECVRWRGLLDEKHLDSMAPAVGVRMPQRVIEVGHGQTAMLRGLALPIAEGATAEWSKAPLNTEIEFSARFLGSAELFSSLEVSKLSSGRSILTIGLTDAHFIRLSATCR